MRAFRFLTMTALVAASVATASVSQAQPRRPRPAPGAAPAAPPPAAPAAAPIPPAAQAPGDIAPNAPTLLSRESELRRGLGFQAFVDGQFTIMNENNDANRGFTLNDAALYFSKDFGQGFAAMIDLPFAAEQATNSVNFGTEKAQAFVQWNTGVMTFKAGQFDTIFGVEQNDSKDRFFTDWGVVKGNQIPLTHMGLLVGAGWEHFMVRGLIADPRDTSTQAGQNLEFGLQGRFDFAPFYVALGALYNDGRPDTTDRTNLLIDLMGGVKFDAFRIDAFYNNKSTYGAPDASNSFGLLGSFNLNPELALGTRLEFASDLVALDDTLGSARTPTGLADSVFSIAVGPSWRILPEVTLRGDLTFINVDNGAGVEDDSIFGGTASIVAGF